MSRRPSPFPQPRSQQGGRQRPALPQSSLALNAAQSLGWCACSRSFAQRGAGRCSVCPSGAASCATPPGPLTGRAPVWAVPSGQPLPGRHLQSASATSTPVSKASKSRRGIFVLCMHGNDNRGIPAWERGPCTWETGDAALPASSLESSWECSWRTAHTNMPDYSQLHQAFPAVKSACQKHHEFVLL